VGAILIHLNTFVMAKEKCCAEIILGIKNETNIKGYPILLRERGTGKEIVAIRNKDSGWDVFIYASHGSIFTRTATGLSSDFMVGFINEIDPTYWTRNNFN
jgi:hypothetical protein